MRAGAAVRGYVICSQPRSGTNLLCQLLESTGRLGRPQDYFNGAGLRARGRSDYPLDREAQWAAILTEGCTPNGVYGLKMFCERFEQAAATRWPERLPSLQYVFLERRDLLGRALSEVRAIQTGQFRAKAIAKGSPYYDPYRIRRQLQIGMRDHARWKLYFTRNGIVPLNLCYEDVVLAPQGAADSVARLVGLDEPVRIDEAAVTLAVQRDALTEDWRARFLESERNLCVLDDPGDTGRLRDVLRSALRRWRRNG